MFAANWKLMRRQIISLPLSFSPAASDAVSPCGKAPCCRPTERGLTLSCPPFFRDAPTDRQRARKRVARNLCDGRFHHKTNWHIKRVNSMLTIDVCTYVRLKKYNWERIKHLEHLLHSQDMNAFQRVEKLLRKNSNYLFYAVLYIFFVDTWRILFFLAENVYAFKSIILYFEWIYDT